MNKNVTTLVVAGAIGTIGVLVWYFYFRESDDGEVVVDISAVDAVVTSCGDCVVDSTVDGAPIPLTALQTGIKLKAGMHQLEVKVMDSQAALMTMWQYMFMVQPKVRVRVMLHGDGQASSEEEPLESVARLR